MKNTILIGRFIAMFFATILATSILAQQPTIQNWRPYDQTGINVFEPAKDLDTEFQGLKVRIGGAFTQQFQALSHTNDTLDILEVMCYFVLLLKNKSRGQVQAISWR